MLGKQQELLCDVTSVRTFLLDEAIAAFLGYIGIITSSKIHHNNDN